MADATQVNADFQSLQSQITTRAVSVKANASVIVPSGGSVNLSFAQIDWDVLGEYSSTTGFREALHAPSCCASS